MHVFGIASLDRLINELSYLPGIGRKTAQRLAVFILKSDPEYAGNLAQAILNVKQETRLCRECFNMSEAELCHICADPRRDQTKICVVEDIVDIFAIEASGEFRGLYHVLGGVISPLAGVTPDRLHIKELVERVEKGTIQEVLLALNPSTEGEATMIYISRLVKAKQVKVTRIASGVPIGSHLEYVDTLTIGRAISSRQEL
jgi:recombination protein RecR